MILAATGHRPTKLGGYGEDIFEALVALAAQCLSDLRPTSVISGMALGWDTAWAVAALRTKVPFWAVIPFEGQEKKWPSLAQDRYHKLLFASEGTFNATASEGYAAWKMQKRNALMVDKCDGIVALWDGSPGGTANCLDYNNSLNPPKPVMNYWQTWLDFRSRLCKNT